MDEYETLNHTTWDCKYHVVFIPKYRRKLLFQELRKPLGKFLSTCGSEGIEGRRGAFASGPCSHAFVDPTKIRGVERSRYIKEKSAIHLARTYSERKRNFVGQSFWARGYFVSTVGRDEKAIREYIQNQEKEDQRLEQLNLWKWRPPSGGPCSWSRVSVSLRRSLERPQSQQSRQRRHSRFERLTS